MIEAPVPEDVRKYQGKIIGPFNKRQVLFIGIAIAFDAIVMKVTGINFKNESFIYLIACMDIPILLFAFDMNGEPMEKFLWNTLIRGMITPKKRIQKTIIEPEKIEEIKEKEEILEIGFQKTMEIKEKPKEKKQEIQKIKKKHISQRELNKKIKENPNLEEFY